MNKVFSKIAGLSVGLAMAIGVGVAVGQKSVARADAALVETNVLDLTTQEYGTGNYNTTVAYGDWTIKYGANNNKGWAFFKMGGKSATLADYNPCDIYTTKASTVEYKKVIVHGPSGSLSKNGMSINSWGLYVYSDSTLSTQVDYVAGGEITNAEWSCEFTPSAGKTWAKNYYYKVSWDLANSTSTNGIVCVDNITCYEEVTGQALSVPNTAVTAVGRAMSVKVDYTNIGEGGISVTSGAAVSVPAKLDVTGTGTTTLSIIGVSVAESVTVTLSAGTAQAEINVSVINPDYFYLVDDINKLTDGSRFTLIAENAGKLYYPYGFNSSGYYETNEVPVFGDGYVGVDGAIEYTLDFINGEAYIMDGADYVGASSVSNTAKIVLTEDHSANYNTFKISSVEESTKVEIELDTADEGTSKRINMNTSNGRLANYSVNNASLISVYASYLAPAVYIPYSGQNVSMKDDETHYETCVPLNFGDEVVAFNVQTSDDKVATATVSGGQLVITGVGSGDATLTVSANSTSYSASLSVSVHVSSSQRHLDHLVLSKSTDSLYKGQEFSYSGTVTAVYDNSDEVLLDNSAVTFDGYDMSTIGNQTVTVSYTDVIEKTETYTLTVSQWEGVLTIDSYYVLASEYTESQVDHKYAMIGAGKIGTANVGLAASYSTTLRSESALLVKNGSTYNSYAFKLGTGKYLAAANSNSLTVADDVSDASSWTVEESSGNYVITNVSYNTRKLQFNAGSDTVLPRFAAYTSNQKPVTLKSVTYTDIASHFTTNFMHPEISVDDKGTGECLGETGYYALAKAAFNVMPEESRVFFMTSTMYTNYKARLAAWAAANGDEFNEVNLLVANPASRVAFDAISDNNTMIIVISIAATSALAFTMLLVFKKKKQK